MFDKKGRFRRGGTPGEGEIFRAPVESIASGGSGVARAGGMTVFLEQTAPGDVVSARITESHNTWARGQVERIESPSPDRTQPPCPAWGVCGGCSLQHLTYKAQLAAKTRILEDTFTRIGGFEPPAIRVFPSPAWGYRNRVQLHRREDGALGFRGRRSGEIAPLADCPAADGGIRRLLAGERRPGVELPGREITRFSIYSRGDLLLVEGGKPSRGEMPLLDRTLRLEAGLFFQGNGVMQELLIAGVLEAAEKADPGLPAADIHAGVGVFALFLADRFRRLSLVEENSAALALARENLGPAAGAVFFAEPAGRWAETLKTERFGFAVTDPPRGGMERNLAERLAQRGPSVLACVSCNPATLARDARILREGGYALDSLALYDFYPQTAHIESLAVFTRYGDG